MCVFDCTCCDVAMITDSNIVIADCDVLLMSLSSLPNGESLTEKWKNASWFMVGGRMKKQSKTPNCHNYFVSTDAAFSRNG